MPYSPGTVITTVCMYYKQIILKKNISKNVGMAVPKITETRCRNGSVHQS